MAISFSHVQNAAALNTDPATVTLGAAPTQYNLLIAAAAERSGGSANDFTITGTGWTKRVSRTIEQGNSTYRRTLVVWTKEAGSGETSSFTIDDGTANSKTGAIIEYSHGAGASGIWTFEDAVSNDNGQTSDASQIGTGTTLSIGAGSLLEVGIIGIKRPNNTNTWTSSWTNNLSERADYGDGLTSGRQITFADYLLDTAGGTKNSTATLTTGSNLGLAAALIVFSATESGGGGSSASGLIYRLLAG